MQFCRKLNVPPLPVHDSIPLLYVTHLYMKGLAPVTISVHLAAIRALHILAGCKVPVLRTPQVNLALKGMKQHYVVRARHPIDFQLLHRMYVQLLGTKREKLWKAVLCLAFFAGLRSAEYATTGSCKARFPTVGSLKFKESVPPSVQFTVSQSKTCPQGFTVPVGCTGHEVCAYCSLLKYRQYRQDKGSWVVGTPLFRHRGVALSAALVNEKIKALVQALGIDSTGYSSHSLRIGAATTAATSGFADWELQRLGGWKSQCYKQYVRARDSHIAGFAARMTSQDPTS